MIEAFAKFRGTVSSDFLDLDRTGQSMILVSSTIAKFARDTSIEVKKTSEPAHQDGPKCWN